MRLNQTTQDLEEIAESSVEKDPAIEEALRTYASLPENYWQDKERQNKTEYALLTPAQINLTLQALIQPEVADTNIGPYVSRLIQKSYDAGNNHFTLETRNVRIRRLGKGLQGRPKNKITTRIKNWLTGNGAKDEKLKLAINGDVGEHCCEDVARCELDILGYAGDFCGDNATDSSFRIRRFAPKSMDDIFYYLKNRHLFEDGAGDWFGINAKNCRFEIAENIGLGCGLDAEKCHFKIGGAAGNYCGGGAKYSRFDVIDGIGSYSGKKAWKSKFFVGGVGANCGQEAMHCKFIIDEPLHELVGYSIGKGSVDCKFKERNWW